MPIRSRPGSTLCIPALTFVNISGYTIRNEINAGSTEVPSQTNARMIKEATGVVFMTVIKGKISRSAVRSVQQSTAVSIPAITAAAIPALTRAREAKAQSRLLGYL